jgi:hypothetical protein
MARKKTEKKRLAKAHRRAIHGDLRRKVKRTNR